MSREAIVIGIAGGTGSGKSTMVRRIQEEFGPAVALLSHDFYYKAHDELSYEERCRLNYDHPNSFDTDLMIRHLKSLKRGKRSSARSTTLRSTTVPWSKFPWNRRRSSSWKAS